LKRKKNKYAEAVAVKFHEYSPQRAQPFCQHYGVCGGCKWQCLSYADQIKYKQKQVTDSLTQIGKVELPEISPILGSEKTEFYRNKLEFTFSDKRWLTEEEVKADVKYDQMNAVGFHIPGAFENPRKIRVLRHFRLNVNMILIRRNAASEVHPDDFANSTMKKLRVLRHGDRVHIRHKKERFVIVLIINDLFDSPAIISDRQHAARLQAGQESFFHRFSNFAC
jgi:hypothetical protein